MYKYPGEATVRGSGGSQVARAPVSLLEHQLQIARFSVQVAAETGSDDPQPAIQSA